MEILNVIAAAIAAFAFGAVWYIALARPWQAAAGVTEEQTRAAGPTPFVIGIVAMILVAGMMQHVLATSGVTTVGGGAVAGLGLGAFVVLPWVAMNYAFSLRKPALTLVDGVNCTIGCGIMGAVLTAF
jgi:hypothetical protein